jgi:polyisoprenoid-binding protein YceI
MKKRLFYAILLTSSLSLFASKNNLETWKLDEQHTSVSFDIGHFGISKIRGLMSIESGELKVDPKNLSTSELEVKINVNSLNTMVAARDTHVKSKDFLDAEKFPFIVFKSTGVREDKINNKMYIDGTLTIKDKTKPVTLLAEPISEEVRIDKNGGQKIVRGTLASATINRLDFGIDYGTRSPAAAILSKIVDGGVGREITISISTELAKMDSALAKSTKK